MRQTDFCKTIYIVSPIWPTSSEPASGTFVKVIADGLSDRGWIVNTTCVGRSKFTGIVGKFERYVRVCLGQIAITFMPSGIVYLHLPTWFTVFTWFPLLLSRKPLVVNLHGSEIHARKKIASAFWWNTRRIIGRAKKIIVPSLTFSNVASLQIPDRVFDISASGGYRPDRFGVFSGKNARDELKIGNDVLVLGYVSRIVEGKGWRTFIETVQEISSDGTSVKAIIIGSGSDELKLRNFIKENNLTEMIIYLGPVDQEKLYYYISAMDIFLFTSKIDNVDTLGLAAIEAIACGIPVVALHSTLMREYIVPQLNGEFAMEYSGVGFADGVRRLLNWPKRDASEISATALRYRSDNVSDELSKSFHEISL